MRARASVCLTEAKEAEAIPEEQQTRPEKRPSCGRGTRHVYTRIQGRNEAKEDREDEIQKQERAMSENYFNIGGPRPT